MGAKFSGMIFGKRSSRVRNSSSSEEENLPPPIRRPFNKNYKLANTSIKPFHGKSSILNIRQSSLNNNSFGNVQVSNPKTQYSQASSAQASSAQAGPAQVSSAQASSAQAGPAQAGPAQQRQNRSLMNKIRGREINTNKRQLNSAKKKDIFSLLDKNTTFILQRHATSCANIINKGFKTGSTSYSVFGKSRFVAEIAPDSMLSSIGIDECNQVHDYLTNQGTEITKLDQFEYLFCCSELIRTQQTMFLSYFELIDKHGIKIMILPWLNEERAVDTFGVVNKDNLTITFAETKLRWARFILKTFEGNEDLINKYSNWDNVFDLPDFIYRTPKGPEATFDKRVDLEKLYKIKMEESKILTEPGKQSYNADDLLFALPFILYFSEKAKDLQKQLKIFMTGHSRTMVKLINLITLRSASNLDLRSMIKKGVNKIKGVKMITGEESPYYSKPYLEKQQMMNAEIIQLEPVNLMRVFGGRDKFEKFEHLSKNNIDTLSNKSKNNSSEIIITDFNLCRKFPVGFSEYVISKQLKDETFKEIKPFYFFYNSNLGIVYSLVDIIEQKIQTSNEKLYKEGYPLRVFFGMTLLQYVGYLMVAKLVVSKMKEEFKENLKYDYQGLLDNISELDTKIHIYVGDTGNVNSKQNFEKLPKPNASNPAQSQPQSNKLNKLEGLIKTITQKGFNPENQSLNGIAFKSGNNSFTIKKIIDNYLNIPNIDSINIDNIDNIISGMLKKANVHNDSITDELKQYTKYWFCNKLYIKYTQRPQTAGQDPSIAIAIKYMEKNATEYFDKKAKQFPKYSTTIKQFLFVTLPALEHINDRQLKRKEFVKLLHTSLLSTCNIEPNQQNKITDFMKNSFPTGLLEQESRTPTRENTNKGQGMLERVEKLNERTGSYLLKDSGYLIVPFIPLSSDGQNQLDKIIEHMKKMGGFYLTTFEGSQYRIQTKITRADEIYIDLNDRTRIYTSPSGPPLLKFMYPSINDSVGRYIVGMIYKILITYTNYNFYYSQMTKYLASMLIIIYINYGIQYLLDFLKKAYIIFSVIENFTIPDIINRILRQNKKNYSILSSKYMFFSNTLISTDVEDPYHEKPLNQFKSVFTKKKRNYSIEEKILHVKRYYYYVSYFYNEDVKKYYEKYGLIFLYFSLYIPDLIYYISDNKDFNKNIKNILEPEQHEINYAKKIQYLFKLSDYEIKNKSIAVIDEFLPKLIDYIKTINHSNYDIISESNINLNIDKLYDIIMGRLSKSNSSQVRVTKDYYSTNNSTNNSKKNDFEKNFNEIIKLITEPVHFESNEKAFATISGIPAKFDKNLVSPHFFAFEFDLYKIKEVCLKGLMKFSKKDCIQFVKADISNIMECVKQLFKSETTDIWKYFVEIHIRLIKEGYVFANQELKTLIYISRLFGSSFDGILEIFYQSFPYMMFCFEYVTKIASRISNTLIPPCQILNELFDIIGLEKMIILYKYLNITNIEVMEYIKKYGIIFLIYALLTPFHIFQTELTGKNITLHKQIIIDKLKAMYKVEIVKMVESVIDDNKIVEFIRKVGENKNDIFGKVSVAQSNNNNINSFNLSKVSNNGTQYNGKNKPSLSEVSQIEPNGQNADFIWSCFTVPPFVPLTVEGNRNVLDEIIAFYKRGHGVYKKKVIEQINKDYQRCKEVFVIICKNYLKINDDTKIRDFYNLFWKIIAENYGNLNINFSQRAKLLIYISALYKYEKIRFFKNIYLVNSFAIENLYSNFFLEKKYIEIKKLGKNFMIDPMNSASDHYRKYLILGLGKLNPASDILDNLFTLLKTQIIDIKIFNTLLYYVFNYNDNDIKEYYETYGLIFLYFLLNLPNYILFDDYINNEKLMANYPEVMTDVNNKNLQYIIELSKNEEVYKKKSNDVIKEYINDYSEYVKSLNTELNFGNVSNNANKSKTITFVNNGQNNSVKAKYNNSSNSLEKRQEPEPKQVDIYRTTLTQGVYFLS